METVGNLLREILRPFQTHEVEFPSEVARERIRRDERNTNSLAATTALWFSRPAGHKRQLKVAFLVDLRGYDPEGQKKVAGMQGGTTEIPG